MPILSTILVLVAPPGGQKLIQKYRPMYIDSKNIELCRVILNNCWSIRQYLMLCQFRILLHVLEKWREICECAVWTVIFGITQDLHLKSTGKIEKIMFYPSGAQLVSNTYGYENFGVVSGKLGYIFSLCAHNLHPPTNSGSPWWPKLKFSYSPNNAVSSYVYFNGSKNNF